VVEETIILAEHEGYDDLIGDVVLKNWFIIIILLTWLGLFIPHLQVDPYRH
jgi:hypothetical protein